MSATQTYASRIRGQFGVQLFKNSFFIIAEQGLVAASRVRVLAAGDPLLLDRTTWASPRH